MSNRTGRWKEETIRNTGKGSNPQKKDLCAVLLKRFVVDAKAAEPLGQWRQLNTRENILDRMICSHYIPLRKYIGDAMKEFIKVMKALSDSNRAALLKLLQKRKMCVCQRVLIDNGAGYWMPRQERNKQPS